MAQMRRVATPKIIQPKAASRGWVVLFLLVILMGSIGWFAFDYGKMRGGYSAGRSGSAIERLNETITALEKERDDLRQRLAAAERALQVDTEATRLAKLELADSQREKEELEKDVELLRNLVKEDAAGALRLKDFVLAASPGERVYTYRFMVTQMKESFGVSKGRIRISVSGVFDGYAKTYSMQELSADKTDSHKMRFRHFQDVQGALVLPEGFSPQSLSVEIDPASNKMAPLTEVFDWRLTPDANAGDDFSGRKVSGDV